MIVGSNILAGASGQQGYFLNRSVRTRSSASAYFNRTPVSATNRKTFTWSGWVKRGILGSAQALIESGNGSGIYTLFWFSSSDQIQLLQDNGGGGVLTITTNAVFRDPSAWYHIVIAIDTTQATANNRTIIYVNGINQLLTYSTQLAQNADTWINFTYQHRLDGRTSGGSYFDGYTTEINFIDGQALTPTSFGEYNTITGVWQPKKYVGTYGTNGFYLQFTNNTLSTLLSTSGNISAPFGGVATNALVADGVYCTSNTSTGSVFTFILNDFGSATQVTRYTIVNLSFTGGVSTFSVQGSPDNSTWTTFATLAVTASNQSFSGSLNGNFRYWRLAPTAFGTNGQAAVDQCVFFQDGLGLDFSGNGNNWTPNNIFVTAGVTYDSMTDVPTLTNATTANYCVINPLGTGVPSFKNSTSLTIADGNLSYSKPSGTGYFGALGSFAMPLTGKWYWEFTSTTNVITCGISVGADYASSGEFGIRVDNTSILVNGSSVQTGLSGLAVNNVIGCAWNADSNSFQFYKNGSTYGTAVSFTPASGASYYPYLMNQGTGISVVANANFGQRPFSYTPPTGFVALNTYNLPTPTIANGANQFAATIYTGTGAARTITNTVNTASFQPDFLWIKNRSSATAHALTNSVAGITKYLESNTLNVETTDTTSVTALNSNGFNLGVGTSIYSTNTNGATFVAWQWKASNAAAVTNTSGTISSQVSANPSAGFSVVTYTGTGANATVGHGLGIAPVMILNKARGSAFNWHVYFTTLGNGDFEGLNTFNAYSSGSNWFNLTAPTSSVFSVGAAQGTATYVNYCFAPIAGYSAFGKYTGNGSTDGVFVYLGFRPRWLMIKRSDVGSTSWGIYDTSRNPYNVSIINLYANLPNADSSGAANSYDLLSNGFKLRNADTFFNASGGTYVYAAFAENPFSYSLAR